MNVGFLGFLKRSFVLAAFGLTASEAASDSGQIAFCNRQQNRISVVIVHYMPKTDNWFMSGWQSASPGQCTSFKLESTDTVVYHARTVDGSLSWPGASSADRKWCVGPSRLKRNILGARECASDEEHLPFSIVKPTGASFFLNLN